MGAAVEIDGKNLRVEGHGTITSVGVAKRKILEQVLYGTLEGAGDASLRSLREALVSLRRQRGDAKLQTAKWSDARLWVGISRLAEAELQRDLGGIDPAWIGQYLGVPPTSPALFLEGDSLFIRIEIWTESDRDPQQIESLLAPFVERHGASCEVVVSGDRYENVGFAVAVDIDWPFPDDATVADAWLLGDEAHALLRAAEGDELPRSAALDLICAGRWDLFKGLRENDWLEAKGAPYDHLEKKIGDNWRFELAKDVAAFANMPEGGMIVLGFSTEDRGDGDVINGYDEFKLSRVEASKYATHVAQLVYPRVAGFEVRRVEGKKKDHGVVVLVIPSQLDESKPFLVQGTITEGKVMGAHVLLPVRRGDDTALADAGAIHSRIRLGEQVLAGKRPIGS